MICKNFLLFGRLPVHFVNSVFGMQSFAFDVVPFVNFCFWCLCSWCHVKKKSSSRTALMSFFPIFSSWSYMVFGLMFIFLIHFELIFVSYIRGSISLFCICFSSFSSTVCSRPYPFPTGYSWLPCWTLCDHTGQDSILSSLFCSMGLSGYFSVNASYTVLLLWLCSVVCGFIFLFFSSALLWFFKVFVVPHNLGLSLLCLWRMPLLFWWGLCWSCRRRQWHPTLVLLPGKSHGWRSLVGCSPWGR